MSILILSVAGLHNAFAQVRETPGGVNVDGSWYLGEGLQKGNYFEYKLCELDLNDCAPVIMKFWVKGDKKIGTETLWDVDVVVEDGNKIVKGSMGLGKTAAEPVEQTDDLFHYARAFKSSLSWLSAFATADSGDLIHGPKEFRDNAWGKIGAIGGSQLIPKRAEQVKTQAGTFDSIVVGWYSGNDNEIWIVDDFPFPVKALTYAWVTTGVAPVMFQFELLDYKKNVTSDPFADVKPTVDQNKVLGCQTEYSKYITQSKSTNTASMLIVYSYAPEHPKQGCNIDWKINFKNKYNQEEFVNEVHYDIWVVDDNGRKIRSLAQDLGRDDLFNGFGLAHVSMPVLESPGPSHYAIFIYGTSPQNVVPVGELAGYVIADIDIEKNDKLGNTQSLTESPTIPDWIKTNAGWWSEGKIDNDSFIKGIQYLIKEGILVIPKTEQDITQKSSEIPDWIKTNAGWWSKGQIDDGSFVNGIQYLIQTGLMTV